MTTRHLGFKIPLHLLMGGGTIPPRRGECARCGRSDDVCYKTADHERVCLLCIEIALAAAYPTDEDQCPKRGVGLTHMSKFGGKCDYCQVLYSRSSRPRGLWTRPPVVEAVPDEPFDLPAAWDRMFAR